MGLALQITLHPDSLSDTHVRFPRFINILRNGDKNASLCQKHHIDAATFNLFYTFWRAKRSWRLGQLRFLRYVSIRTQALSMKAGQPMAELNIVASIFDCADETGTAKITWRRSQFSPSLI